MLCMSCARVPPWQASKRNQFAARREEGESDKGGRDVSATRKSGVTFGRGGGGTLRNGANCMVGDTGQVSSKGSSELAAAGLAIHSTSFLTQSTMAWSPPPRWQVCLFLQLLKLHPLARLKLMQTSGARLLPAIFGFLSGRVEGLIVPGGADLFTWFITK